MELAELRNKPHLSASGIQQYVDCGLQYKFSKIDKVAPEHLSDNLLFGSTIHKVIADFNQEKMIGTVWTAGELEELFESYWIKAAENNEKIKYSRGKSYSALLELGKSLFRTYRENLPDDGHTILAIEEPFHFAIEGMDIPIIGVIDLVEVDSDGSIIITDHKTASKAYSINDVEKNFQLTIYYMAAKSNGYADHDVQLKFDCLIKTRVPRFEQVYTLRDDIHIRRAIKKIRQVWNGIRKGVFIPNDGHWKCTNCEFKHHCNEWFER